MHRHLGRQRGEVLERIEGGRQQGVIAGVGRRRDRGQRNAATLGQLRALQAALAPVDRAATGALTTAGRLGGASIDAHVGQVQTDHLVVGIQAGQPQPIPHAQADPLVAATAHRRRRTRGVGDPLVAGAEDQRLDELAEDDCVLDAGSVTAQRMLIDVRWQQREELLA
jgi:hypothetical protein